MFQTISYPVKNIFSGNLNKHLLGAMVFLFCIYSFLVARTVFSIDQRKSLDTELNVARSTVATSQINYFNLTSGIDMTKASELGFVNSETPDFAYMNPTGQNVVAIANIR